MVAAAVFMVAFAVAKANQCSSGGECPDGNKPNNVASMLQTKLQMNALKDEGGEEMAAAQKGAAERGAAVESAAVKDSSSQSSHRSLLQMRKVTFITVTDNFFEKNLGASSLWKQRDTLPHEWLVLTNDNGTGLSQLYAQAQGKALHPLLVFVHPDVMLPDDWYTNFMLKLAQLEAVDPKWAVLGTAGVPLDWTLGSDDALKIASSITDGMSSPTRTDSTAEPTTFTYKTGIDNLPVQSLDEHLLVLRAESPKFDPNLPGFDLYGTDIVMSAREAGLKSYLLNINVKHKTVDAEGKPFNTFEWFHRYHSPEYQKRADSSKAYMLKKWCGSKFLPASVTCIYGPGFDLPLC